MHLTREVHLFPYSYEAHDLWQNRRVLHRVAEMALTSGSRLGPYEIVSPLGAGPSTLLTVSP